MEKEIENACRHLTYWPKHQKLEEILEAYKRNVRYYIKYKRKVQNPYHYRTGKPLKDSTFHGYQKRFEELERECRTYRFLIKLFILEEIIKTTNDRLKSKMRKYFDELNKKTNRKYYNVRQIQDELRALRQKGLGYSENEIEEKRLLKNLDPKLINEIKTTIDDLKIKIRNATNGIYKEPKGGSASKNFTKNLMWMFMVDLDIKNYWRDKCENLQKEKTDALESKHPKRREPVPIENYPFLKVINGGKGHITESTFTN